MRGRQAGRQVGKNARKDKKKEGMIKGNKERRKEWREEKALVFFRISQGKWLNYSAESCKGLMEGHLGNILELYNAGRT